MRGQGRSSHPAIRGKDEGQGAGRLGVGGLVSQITVPASRPPARLGFCLQTAPERVTARKNGAGMDETGQRQADWRHPVVLAILVLCLVPELVLSGADAGLWGDPYWRRWALQNAGFWSGLLHNWRPNYALQPYAMFLTYGFLHAGAVHFIVNMMTLISLGPPLADLFGARRLVVLYAGSILGGALGFAALSSEVLPMVGASGALFGLAGAHVALHYQERRALHAPQGPVLRAILGLVGLNLVLWWAMNGQLAWQTHLGGFVSGWILALWLNPDPVASSPPDPLDMV